MKDIVGVDIVGMQKKNILFYIKITILSLCSALALSINIGEVNVNYQVNRKSFVEEFFNIERDFGIAFVVVSTILLFAIFVWVTNILNKKEIHRLLALKLVNVLVAYVWLLAEGYRRENSTELLYSSTGQCIKSIIYLIGIANLLNLFMMGLYSILNKPTKDIEQKHKTVPIKWLCKYPVFSFFVLIMLCWLPHIVVAYPGYFCYDSYFQMYQYGGFSGWTSHHPPASTWLMGTVIKLGTKIKDGNLGLYLYVVMQTVIFALILAYMFSLFEKMNIPRWFRRFAFIIVAIVPYYTGYIGLVVKDNVYSYMVLLFVIELIYVCILKDEYIKSKKHVILFGIAVIGTILLRNNGKFIVYPIIIFFAAKKLVEYLKNQSGTKKELATTLIILFVPVFIAGIISFGLDKKYDIEKGSVREALSLPMQQTARYVKYYKTDVTEKEEAVLRNMMDYDNLSKLYDTRISDPVKKTFAQNPTTGELREYLGVWLAQFMRHPLVYFDATLNQNYYLLYPGEKNNRLYIGKLAVKPGKEYQKKVRNKYGFQDSNRLLDMKYKVKRYEAFVFDFPIFNLLSHPAFYNIILIWLVGFSIKKRRYSNLLICFPMLISFLVIIAAPVIQMSPRYAFPIIYTMPLAVAYYMYSVMQTQETDDTENSFFGKHREVIMYLIFGGLAFIVSMATFALFNISFGINELLANILSWILTVLFAFFTNRIWVFSSKTDSIKSFFGQMGSFFAGRVATLVIEEVILFVFITWLGMNSMLIKLVAQVIVIVLNYVISKLYVFNKA